jgi:uncharacterized protein (DUF1778 family)
MSEGNNARLNFRLPGHLKDLIEQAASELGQSVSEFAIASLARDAREVIQESQQTRLTNRDRDIFLALLDDMDARPNAALKAAARRCKRRLG